MLFFIILFLAIASLKRTMNILNHQKQDLSGYDKRPINETLVNLYEFNKNYQKLKLLKKIQSNNTNEKDKIKLIYDSHLIDELNPNVIKPPNLTKGLKF